MIDRTLFLYYGPHPVHRAFAETIDAEFRYYHQIDLATKTVNSFVNGILLPEYKVYLTEGGAPMVPAAIAKILGKRGININLLGDHTFLMIEYTPDEMRHIYHPLVNFVHDISSKYIDGGIAVSKMIKECVEKRLKVPIKIAYPFIEPNLYSELKKVTPNFSVNNIISIGNGIFDKGMDLLLDAFLIVKNEIKDANLFLIGNNHPKEWSKYDGVHVEGYVKDLIPYFSQSSLYVQASRADAFPVASLEAMRAGIPTIVTEKTGTKEIIEQIDKNLVAPVDAKVLADKILDYFSMSKTEKIRISNQVRSHSTKFNKHEMCALFKEQFNILLQEIS